MSLVVSPLKSLIRDQITELRKHNIMAYGILEGMEKEEIYVLFSFYLFVWGFFLGRGFFLFCFLFFFVLFVSVF
jgi:hypothetical protein